MKCRNLLENPDGTYNIVWFGSYGSYMDDANPTECATYPILGRPMLVPDEYPYAICGFSDIDPADNNSSYCNFSIPKPNLQLFHLKIVANDGKEISFKFYNTDDPTEIFYQDSFTGQIDLIDKITTNRQNSTVNLSFKIWDTNASDDACSTISTFLLKLSENTISKKADNYAYEQDGIAKSLIQRLSVLEGELWYDINYGLPLLQKLRNKAIMDASIIDIINQHPEVRSIIEYSSHIEEKTHVYSFTVKILSIYNTEIAISSEYQM